MTKYEEIISKITDSIYDCCSARTLTLDLILIVSDIPRELHTNEITSHNAAILYSTIKDVIDYAYTNEEYDDIKINNEFKYLLNKYENMNI